MTSKPLKLLSMKRFKNVKEIAFTANVNFTWDIINVHLEKENFEINR